MLKTHAKTGDDLYVAGPVIDVHICAVCTKLTGTFGIAQGADPYSYGELSDIIFCSKKCMLAYVAFKLDSQFDEYADELAAAAAKTKSVAPALQGNGHTDSSVTVDHGVRREARDSLTNPLPSVRES